MRVNRLSFLHQINSVFLRFSELHSRAITAMRLFRGRDAAFDDASFILNSIQEYRNRVTLSDSGEAELKDIESWLDSLPETSDHWLDSSPEAKESVEKGLIQAKSGKVRRRSFVDLEFAD